VKLGSYVQQRMLKLGPPLTREVAVERDLAVPMPDGVTLRADRWFPAAADPAIPTALIRTPYGKKLTGGGMARPLAERGYQVLIQDVRGCFTSEGTFDPMRQERADGLATLEWLVEQPWCAGSIVLIGTSYMGYVQWAVADALPPAVKAMIPHLSESALTLEFLRADGLSLETPFNWGVQMVGMGKKWPAVHVLAGVLRGTRALTTLPLRGADEVAAGEHSAYVQDVLSRPAGDPRWEGIDHHDRVGDVSVPVSLVAGWYDIFLPGQLRDFRTLQDAGKTARLTVGPWTHLSRDNTATAEALGFGLACAHGTALPVRAPVRLFVMGEDRWRDFDAWPPSEYSPRRLHLQAGGGLTTGMPAESAPSRYRYDPADPTPALGGVRMNMDPRHRGGRVDNRRLETRPDVLTYTTNPLDRDVEIVGEVNAEVWFRSSLAHADVFVRLCDVDTSGHSSNICDGLVSLDDAGDIRRATVRLWPTAYRFRRGHRIRVQVSSGAFPRYARNLGAGEPHATATTIRVGRQEVFHDPAHPSAILLPVSTAMDWRG